MFIQSEETVGLKSYSPVWGDVVALQCPDGGFIGGNKGEAQDILIMPHCQEWEYFIFEGIPSKFYLRQKVSGNYIQGNQNDDKPILTSLLEEAAVFKLKALPNGQIEVIALSGKKLSKGWSDQMEIGYLRWSNKETIAESWLFKLIHLRAAAPYRSDEMSTQVVQEWTF